MTSTAANTAYPYQKKFIEIDGQRMAYTDEGAGDAIIFLHGNPTSSYLWRNIMPQLADRGRLIAPDLIGMGDSDKLTNSGPDSYTFVEHRKYLDGLFDAIGVGDNLVFVIHDWGSALGFDWANRHRDRVQGIAYMEAIVQPLSWDFWPENARAVFQGFRSEAGESMVLEKNIFVERILPNAVLRGLDDAEMAVYRKPYIEAGEGRRPTLTWPRQIPISGAPANVVEIVQDYADWLATSELAKLFINADPGSILVGPQRQFCRTWPNQTEVTVPGLHFIQEDSPDEIAGAIKDFVARLRG